MKRYLVQTVAVPDLFSVICDTYFLSNDSNVILSNNNYRRQNSQAINFHRAYLEPCFCPPTSLISFLKNGPIFLDCTEICFCYRTVYHQNHLLKNLTLRQLSSKFDACHQNNPQIEKNYCKVTILLPIFHFKGIFSDIFGE